MHPSAIPHRALPKSPCFQAAPASTSASPQIVQFPGIPPPLQCSPCTRICLPSSNRFQASPSVPPFQYTNLLPRSCGFQVPPLFPGTQIGLPGFGSFQNPFALSLGSCISPDSAVFRSPSFAPVHGYLSQVLLFPGHPPLPQFPCTRIRFQLMLIAAA